MIMMFKSELKKVDTRPASNLDDSEEISLIFWIWDRQYELFKYLPSPY